MDQFKCERGITGLKTILCYMPYLIQIELVNLFSKKQIEKWQPTSYFYVTNKQTNNKQEHQQTHKQAH